MAGRAKPNAMFRHGAPLVFFREERREFRDSGLHLTAALALHDRARHRFSRGEPGGVMAESVSVKCSASLSGSTMQPTDAYQEIGSRKADPGFMHANDRFAPAVSGRRRPYGALKAGRHAPALIIRAPGELRGAE